MLVARVHHQVPRSELELEPSAVLCQNDELHHPTKGSGEGPMEKNKARESETLIARLARRPERPSLLGRISSASWAHFAEPAAEGAPEGMPPGAIAAVHSVSFLAWSGVTEAAFLVIVSWYLIPASPMHFMSPLQSQTALM